MSDLLRVLSMAAEQGASDVHFLSGEPAWIRINGKIIRGEGKIFDNELLTSEIRPLIPDNKCKTFDQGWEVDFSLAVEGTGRFRANCYRDIKGMSACFRHLPEKIKSVNELDLEFGILKLCSRKKGLVLVTGPTGSGKSTTLAAMLDYVNILQKGHIITIEDPVEFVFKEKNCLINQREVHSHTSGFNSALKAALREDPDVVMVGEMRDLETTQTALEVAETGHLVFSTLHTNNAASTVYRIINQFPRKKQDQIRISLASSLIGVVSQELIPTADGQGRVAVREVLLVNHAVANLIREDKIFQIPNVIRMNRGAGMICMQDSLIDLVTCGDISPEAAMLKSPDRRELEARLVENGIIF